MRFDRPSLPPFIDEWRLRGVRAKGGSVDVVVRCYERHVALNITRRDGVVPIVVTS